MNGYVSDDMLCLDKRKILPPGIIPQTYDKLIMALEKKQRLSQSPCHKRILNHAIKDFDRSNISNGDKAFRDNLNTHVPKNSFQPLNHIIEKARNNTPYIKNVTYNKNYLIGTDRTYLNRNNTYKDAEDIIKINEEDTNFESQDGFYDFEKEFYNDYSQNHLNPKIIIGANRFKFDISDNNIYNNTHKNNVYIDDKNESEKENNETLSKHFHSLSNNANNSIKSYNLNLHKSPVFGTILYSKLKHENNKKDANMIEMKPADAMWHEPLSKKFKCRRFSIANYSFNRPDIIDFVYNDKLSFNSKPMFSSQANLIPYDESKLKKLFEKTTV
ncbi:unnamed protein product [Gordionus sp. m RMFG-2023]